MTLHLDLLRHGETEIGGFRGSLDDALTERGWTQLHAAVADRSGWDRIVSSPLQRCARFAQVLAEQRTLPLSFEADLQELHFGAWEGRSAAQLMETDETSLGLFWNDPYAFTPPEGESLTHFSARVQAPHWVACMPIIQGGACCWSYTAASCACCWPRRAACLVNICCRSRWATGRCFRYGWRQTAR